MQDIMTKLKNIKNKITTLFFIVLLFSQCDSSTQKGNLFINTYNSYQPHDSFLFYNDTIIVRGRNQKLLFKVYLKEDFLKIDSLSYGNYSIEFKNIYGEIQSTQINFKNIIDTFKIDLSESDWHNYSNNLLTLNIENNDTLNIIGIDSYSKFSSQTKRVKIWKEDDKYFVNILKISKDSSDNGSTFTKELGAQINEIAKLEIELRKIKKLSLSCSNTMDYYLITKKDTLKVTDVTCGRWNGLSKLYYILNGF